MVGCGDLGSMVAHKLAARGAHVFATSRRPARLNPPVVGLRADWASGHIQELPEQLDFCVVALAPDERSEVAYQALYLQGMEHLSRALKGKLRPSFRLLFVSSTAVYGQQRGEWIDEDSPTEPGRFNGKILLQAETQLARQFSDCVNLRLSGLYGPGRHRLIRSVISGTDCVEQPPSYTNRIHIQDAADLICHLLSLPAPDPVYLGSDDRPATQCEVMDWLADRLKVPRPTRITLEVGQSNQGKRCSNKRIRASGYELKYADYRAGYAQVLGAMNEQ